MAMNSVLRSVGMIGRPEPEPELLTDRQLPLQPAELAASSQVPRRVRPGLDEAMAIDGKALANFGDEREAEVDADWDGAEEPVEWRAGDPLIGHHSGELTASAEDLVRCAAVQHRYTRPRQSWRRQRQRLGVGVQ